MKCTIPEISWHNKDPVLSVDIQPSSEGYYRLASGGTDSHILIWHLTEQTTGMPALECVSDLTRHQKAVNVVRFSPSGKFLASGDDESIIIIWKQKTDQDLEFPGEEDTRNQEQWLVAKVLRGHLEDIYDLSWSPDELNIISGSVDNTAIIWDMKKGHMKSILRDHKSFVQGVAWDPASQLLATLSSDRICRFFNAATEKVISKVEKAIVPGSDPESKPVHLFHDDTMKSFFRRLCFTPCGSLIIAPAGLIKPQEPGQATVNTTLIFTRNMLSRPVAYLPSYSQYSVAVRCCPKLFSLKETGEPALFNLPYRVVFAIATQSSVLLYDTQHFSPFAYIANIHYTRLTDLTWSSDGRILIVSSTDGYCSIITFAENELGEPYNPNQVNKVADSSTKNEVVENECKSDLKENPKIPQTTKNVEVETIKVVNPENPVLGKETTKQESNDNDADEDYCLILEETVNDTVMDDGSTRKTVTKLTDVSESQENANFASIASSSDKKVEIDSCGKSKEGEQIELINAPISSIEKMEVCDEENDTCSVNKSSVVLDTNNDQNVTPSKSASVLSPVSADRMNKTPSHNITPIEKRKPKRVQLITLSSPKSKKKL